MERSRTVVIAGSLLGSRDLDRGRDRCRPHCAASMPAESQSAAASGDATAQADEEAALKAAEPIDPAMIGYHEAGTFPVAFREPRALAVDANGQIYVGGDRAVVRYSGDGKKLAEIALARGTPMPGGRCASIMCIPARLYVGMEDHVEVYDPRARDSRGVAVSPARQAIFTSITTTEHEVWVADAGNRLVWRFDLRVNCWNRSASPIRRSIDRGSWSPNHYFDLAAGTDDLVYVVNPRLLHVEGFTHNGEYETAWGKGSPAVADFFGCCNPAQLAVLPDGSFVTAEKGIPRVKIYSRDGSFQTVVAGPPQLTDTPADLAADRHGRVLVLDGRAAKVRVFERNSSDKGKKK